MKLKDAQGCIIFLKRIILAIGGILSFRSLFVYNKLNISGEKHLKNLPKTNVIFFSTHRTYYTDGQIILHAMHRFIFKKAIK